MAKLTAQTAGKVKARVMSGKTSKGEPLTYNQLKPDIERLREYAQHSSEKFGRKLIKQLDERVQVLEREEPESAGASETTTEAAKTWHELRDRTVEELKTKVKGKLLTATTYCKVRTEFREKKTSRPEGPGRRGAGRRQCSLKRRPGRSCHAFAHLCFNHEAGQSSGSAGTGGA